MIPHKGCLGRGGTNVVDHFFSNRGVFRTQGIFETLGGIATEEWEWSCAVISKLGRTDEDPAPRVTRSICCCSSSEDGFVSNPRRAALKVASPLPRAHRCLLLQRVGGGRGSVEERLVKQHKLVIRNSCLSVFHLEMASTGAKDKEIGGDDDNQQRSSMETPSECADRGHEREARASDDDLTRAPPTSSYSTSSYHLARIQEMEARIAESQGTWSEVDGTASQPAERSGMTNREIFEVLKRRKYSRKGAEVVFEQIPEDEYARAPHDSIFRNFWGPNVEVEEKLAEGEQAEIYGAGLKYFEIDWVVKVFKSGSVLQHLENQIPLASLHSFQLRNDPDRRYRSTWDEAVLLTDERLGWEDRFAIVMDKRWGDLRMLIDHQMMQTSHNQGPPFPDAKQLLGLMLQIASQMNELHSQRPPILHKDLKAANVLVERHELTHEPDLNESGGYMVAVADYECSVGVVGTGLWRAPELLQQLEHRVAGSPLVFTDKCDVYSYGMVCYELVTGRIPFEGCSPDEGQDLVLKGLRPELPVDIDPVVKEIIVSCWQAVPSERPSFDEIEKKFIEDSDGGVSLKVG